MTKPKQMHLLRAIKWFDTRDGNAPISSLSSIFCGVLDYSEESLHEVLNELEARKLVMRDGRTHRGIHYALTFDGQQKIRASRSDDDEEWREAASWQEAA